jgi:hypothetical protein
MIFPAYIFTKDPTVDSQVGLNQLFITIYRGSSLSIHSVKGLFWVTGQHLSLGVWDCLTAMLQTID